MLTFRRSSSGGVVFWLRVVWGSGVGWEFVWVSCQNGFDAWIIMRRDTSQSEFVRL